MAALPRLQLLPVVLLLVRLAVSQERFYPSFTELLATVCPGESACTLGPGAWTVQSPSLASSLTRNHTTVTGATAAPQWRGAVDTTEYATTLNLPVNPSTPLLRIPPNSTLALTNLRIFTPPPCNPQVQQQQQHFELPVPLAIATESGARLRLVNVKIVMAAPCTCFSSYQRFACSQSLPSPYFNVDYGTLTFLSYVTPSLELVNATITCGVAAPATSPSPLPSLLPPPAPPRSPPPPPACVSVVASSGADVLAAVHGPGRPALTAATPMFVYIARDLALLSDSTVPDANFTAARTRDSFHLAQDWLFVAGLPGGATRLDLTGSESLIALGRNTRVVLQDLTLVGLPLGPASSYPLALLRAPVWTFTFSRLTLGQLSGRLALRNVTAVLTAVEVAALARDATAPLVPLPPPPPSPPWRPPPPGEPYVPTCAQNLRFFGGVPITVELPPPPPPPLDPESNVTNAKPSTNTSTAAAAAEASTSPSLLLRRAESMFNCIMTFEDVLFQPSEVSHGSPTYEFDWRREPLCQLLPLQPPDEPPRVQVDVRYTVLSIEREIRPKLLSTAYFRRPYMVMTQDSVLLTGPQLPDGTMTFSQIQSYMEGAGVLLGDPVRPRLLDTQRLAAGINLRRGGASLTLRSMVLTNLAAAALHPLSTAIAHGRTVAAEPRPELAALMTMPPTTTKRGSGGGVEGGEGQTASFSTDMEQGTVAVRHRRAAQQLSAPPPSGSSPPRPFTPDVPSSPPLWLRAAVSVPGGTDATGGLPAGLANFTSCIWVLDFDRNRSAVATAADAEAASGGCGSGSGGNMSRACLDSVVLVVPRSEVVFLARLWSRSHATSDVIDADVARELQYMLDGSVLAGGGGAAAAAAAAARDGRDSVGISLRFEYLTWCGLEGRNITLTAAWPMNAASGGGGAQPVMELELPALSPSGGGGGTAGPLTGPPPLPPPASPGSGSGPAMQCLGSSAGCLDNVVRPTGGFTSGLETGSGSGSSSGSSSNSSSSSSPRVILVAAVCGVAAGLLVSLLVCVVVVICVRRRRRGRAGSPFPAADQDSRYSLEAAPVLADRSCVPYDAVPPSALLSGPAVTATAAAAAAPCVPEAVPRVAVPLLPAAVYAPQSFGCVSFPVSRSTMNVEVEVPRRPAAATAAVAAATTAAATTQPTGQRLPEMLQTSYTVELPGVSDSASLSPWARRSARMQAGSGAAGDGEGDVAAATLATVLSAADGGAAPSAASVAAALSPEHQQLLLKQVALSLHTRVMRMRDSIATASAAPTGIPSAARAAQGANDGPMGRLLPERRALPEAVPPGRSGHEVNVAVGDVPAAAAETCALTVTGELGRGAQGVVYRGIWRGIDVAVKSLLLHRAARDRGGGGVAFAASAATPSELTQQRALREAAISVAASQHPNVVATYHVETCALRSEGLQTTATTTATAMSAAAAAAGTSADTADCWKITLISQLCDGGSLRSALASGLLARTATYGFVANKGSKTTTVNHLDVDVAAAPPAASATVVWGSGRAYGALGAPTSVSGGAAAAAVMLQSQQQQQEQLLQPHVMLLLALDVASGLAQLHSTNIVHGDISSSNVLLVSLAGPTNGSDRGDTAATGTAAAAFLSTTTTGSDSYGTGKVAAAHGNRSCDQISTGDGLLGNSSDALALLMEQPYERARRARYNRGGGGQSGGRGNDAVPQSAKTFRPLAASAAAAALGQYGYVAKLCDFGLAEVLPPGQSYISTPCRRSSLYSAPELALEGRLLPASDVYSWGVLTWEMAQGSPLPAVLAAPSAAAVRAWLAAADATAEAEARALPPALLSWPAHVPHALVVLAGECLRADPAGRPTAGDVVQRLEHIVTSL